MTIPQDIIYSIIAAVGDDRQLLKRCALVSSSWLLPSRKQLFSQVYLRSIPASQRLHQVLIQNPVLQCFVKCIIIQYDSQTSNLLSSASLLAFLRLAFSNLEIFSIRVRPYFYWNRLSSETTDALSNIVHSATLKTLGLNNAINVPVTLFFGVIHLRRLELDSLPPNHFVGGQSNAPTPTAFREVATTASCVSIDECVWYIRKTEHGMMSLALYLLTSR
jgi:hypothetical protein